MYASVVKKEFTLETCWYILSEAPKWKSRTNELKLKALKEASPSGSSPITPVVSNQSTERGRPVGHKKTKALALSEEKQKLKDELKKKADARMEAFLKEDKFRNVLLAETLDI